MLARLRKKTEDNEGGFTLIELLVVIIIIGILAAIAIPVFLNQRKKGVDASIKSDVRQAANEMESYFTDTQSYTNDITKITIKKSSGNVVEVALSTTTTGGSTAGDGFCVRGSNPKATADGTKYYWYDSKTGGLQGTAAAAPTGTGACSSGNVGTFTTLA